MGACHCCQTFCDLLPHVRVVPRGPDWRRHVHQLQPRYVLPDDTEPGDTPRLSESREENPPISEQLPNDTSTATTRQPPTSQNVSSEYGPSHPRRSKRPRKPRKYFFVNLANFYRTGEVLRVVISRTFHGVCLPRSPWRWLLHRVCRQIIYSRPRVDFFCAPCTSWSVAKYCRLCW